MGSRKKKKKGSYKRLQKTMRKLMDIVIQYKDQDERVLSDPFMKLPTKKELPDYYEVIKRPVDISKILNKINDEKVMMVRMECLIMFCNNFLSLTV